IILGKEGNAEDPVYQEGPIDIANAVGNHMIISDIGMQFTIKESTLKLYTQTIFEKGRGDSTDANIRDKLIGFNIAGKDRLLGLSWEIKTQSLLEKILVERISTKHQGGPAIFHGRYNYYNNATYATGWAYHNQIIGTPLFIHRKQSKHYNLNVKESNESAIISNRVSRIHAGIQGRLSPPLHYRGLITFVKHFGNYYNGIAFTPFKKQSYFLGEVTYVLRPTFKVTVSLGIDFGDLSKNMGSSASVNWKLK